MSETRPLKDPHLLDLGNLPEIAEWIFLSACSGVIGAATYDLIKNIKNRFGKKRVMEIKQQVFIIFETTREELLSDRNAGGSNDQTPGLSHEELSRLLEDIFKEYA